MRTTRSPRAAQDSPTPTTLRPVTWPTLPPRWATVVLPHEVPNLTTEIISAIRAEIPEYRRALDGPYGTETRRGVEQALHTFVRQIAHGRPNPELDEVFRVLGRIEAAEGRPHDVLLAAYRVGSMVAMRRIGELMERAPLPAETAVALASSVMAFVDRLAALSARGYQEAHRARDTQADRLRSRLAKMLLDQPATPVEAIQGLAARIGWDLPEQVQVVDVRGGASRDVRDLFGDRALTGVEPDSPVLVVPAPVGDDVLEEVGRLGGTVRVSVGSAVDLEDAPRSLRWAQMCSELRDSGLIADRAVTVCDDYLPTLLALSNPRVGELLVRRRLGPLLALPPQKRLKLARLLAAWLELGGTQADVAESLELHRQTAQYQFAKLSAMFGDELHDRTARVEMVLALRSVLLRWENDEA